MIRPLKGIVIDEGDCPSLLQLVDTSKPMNKTQKQMNSEFVLTGKTLPTQWNE